MSVLSNFLLIQYTTIPSEDLFGPDVPEWTALVDILTGSRLSVHLARRVVCVEVGCGFGPYGEVAVETSMPVGSGPRLELERSLAARASALQWLPSGEDGARMCRRALSAVTGDVSSDGPNGNVPFERKS